MSSSTTGRAIGGRPTRSPHAPDRPGERRVGPLGRLALAVTAHGRLTVLVWVLLVVGLGVFAPRVEGQLSGAGWQADGSDSVAVREAAQAHFGGDASHAIQIVVHSDQGPVMAEAGAVVIAEATRLVQADPRIAEVVAPSPVRRSRRTAGRPSSWRAREPTRTRWSEPRTT